MNLAKTIEEVRQAVREARQAGKCVALVPTMGALHAGHMSLIDTAKGACDFVAVSIFVNPTQFGPGEDLAAYPRTPEEDLAACEERGVDLVFLPDVKTMYGAGGLTTVSVAHLPDTLCGRTRPGHFAGVCTVVAKLFNIVQPDRAFFGAKDYQQAAIIRRMTSDLNFPIEIVVCPTVRESDGLAMSSRNRNLSPAERKQAVALSQSLQLARQLIEESRPPAAEVIQAMKEYLAETAPDGEVDYLQIVDPRDLSDVAATDKPVLVAMAVKFSRARLIDNMLVDSQARTS
ncbi:MAG TPA: pantoate--beta-alanine ligase [Phycisphaerae bacterium]|mgnify:FL=1|nr:pantoate--beta-alanine ligase [Phycisphaerae bacterium]